MNFNEHMELRTEIIEPGTKFMKLKNILSSQPHDYEIYYKTENTIIINGDSLEVLNKLPEESINMIFADPPYFLSNE